MTRCLGAKAVDNADYEHGFGSVIPGFVGWTGYLVIVPVAAELPVEPAECVCQKMKATVGAGIAGEERSQNVHAEDEQGDSYQALSDAIDAMR